MNQQQEIEKQIRENIGWTKLPTHIKQHFGNSQKEYEKVVVTYCIKNQIRYKGSLVRHIRKDEKKYYEELLQYSKDQLMLYPYHLSDIFVKGLRLTPFNYYVDVLCELMQSERSYDTLPNFTAADCLRMLGIGRNQYIDLMNRYRSTKRLFSRRKPVRQFLPTQPLEVNLIEPWWIVNVGCVTDDDVRALNQEEKNIIDQLIDNHDAMRAGDLNYECIQSLFRKGYIYIDVPVDDTDYIQVPPLEGFVMNRTLGDYFETLLYKLFVSIDENTSVSELATILDIDISLVKNAISMYCRLGFAKKKPKPDQQQPAEYGDSSWINYKTKQVKKTTKVAENTLLDWNVQQVASSTNSNFSISSPDDEPSGEPKQPLVLDVKALNTQSLMISSNLDEFFQPIDDETTPASGAVVNTELTVNVPGKKRIGFLFDSTLTAFLMMGNLSPGLKNHAVTMFEVGKLSDQCLDNFLLELDKVSQDVNEGEAQRYFDHARILKSTIQFLRYNKDLKMYSGGTGEDEAMGIDLLRCESLSSLDNESKKRILAKNYSLLISMAPFSSSGESNTSPPITFNLPYHVGPIIPEMNSVWFKLYLYNLTANGPPTLLLPRGYRLKCIPSCFKYYDRLLVTSWGHDPFISNQVNVLMTLNDALTHSPILIQAYGTFGIDGTLINVPFNDSSHSLFNHPAVQLLHEKLQLQHFCGYITLLNPYLNNNNEDVSTPNYKNWYLLDLRFGIPLFDNKLNLDILTMIKDNSLFSKKNLDLMLTASRKLVLNLLQFIQDNQSVTILHHQQLHHNAPIQTQPTTSSTLSIVEQLKSAAAVSSADDETFDVAQEENSGGEYKEEYDCLLGNIKKTILHPTQCILFSNSKLSIWDGKTL